MLPIIHKKAYQDFLTLLMQLETHCQNATTATEIARSEEIWASLSQFFQQQIIPLTDEDLSGEVASRWVSLQTEIQREFRLLNTDWLFWASARQPATKEARAKNILERLRKSIGYCRVLLQD